MRPLALLGTLPLGAASDLGLGMGFSTLAAPARRTRFAAGSLSAAGEAARLDARLRDSGGAVVLAAWARLGGMVGGGSEEERWPRQRRTDGLKSFPWCGLWSPLTLTGKV